MDVLPCFIPLLIMSVPINTQYCFCPTRQSPLVNRNSITSPAWVKEEASLRERKSQSLGLQDGLPVVPSLSSSHREACQGICCMGVDSSPAEHPAWISTPRGQPLHDVAGWVLAAYRGITWGCGMLQNLQALDPWKLSLDAIPSSIQGRGGHPSAGSLSRFEEWQPQSRLGSPALFRTVSIFKILK